jgi:dihydrofolate reductase
MGLLIFSTNVTLDGCVDHQEGIADNETHAFFTRLMDESGAMLWGRVTYEMMESYWPAVARGEAEVPPPMREWAVKLDAKPKYVVSSTRNDFPWNNSHHIAGDLRTGVQNLKGATPAERSVALPRSTYRYKHPRERRIVKAHSAIHSFSDASKGEGPCGSLSSVLPSQLLAYRHLSRCLRKTMWTSSLVP